VSSPGMRWALSLRAVNPYVVVAGLELVYAPAIAEAGQYRSELSQVDHACQQILHTSGAEPGRFHQASLRGEPDIDDQRAGWANVVGERVGAEPSWPTPTVLPYAGQPQHGVAVRIVVRVEHHSGGRRGESAIGHLEVRRVAHGAARGDDEAAPPTRRPVLWQNDGVLIAQVVELTVLVLRGVPRPSRSGRTRLDRVGPVVIMNGFSDLLRATFRVSATRVLGWPVSVGVAGAAAKRVRCWPAVSPLSPKPNLIENDRSGRW
jgi:hypothetical protein